MVRRVLRTLQDLTHLLIKLFGRSPRMITKAMAKPLFEFPWSSAVGTENDAEMNHREHRDAPCLLKPLEKGGRVSVLSVVQPYFLRPAGLRAQG